MSASPAMWVFALSTGAILYTYLIYPLLLRFVRPHRAPQDPPANWPKVSVLFSVYNEEKHIAEKIENTLALRYPDARIEILIGSDGSTDRTNEILRQFADPRIRVFEFSPRCGKPSVLNRLVPRAEGEILVLTDANAMLAPDALAKLARHFSDPRIGGVCGRVILYGPQGESGEIPYWTWENFLKERESALDSCLGANGPIYAIRRSTWPQIPDHTLVDDFVIAMRVREQGLRVVYDPEATATEELPPTVEDELKRRIRIGAGDFQSLFLCWRSLLIWHGYFSISFWSHKVLRWFAPFLMLAAFVANFRLLPNPLFGAVFASQLSFYGLALIGWILRGRHLPLVSIVRLPYYFLLINFALLVGFVRFVTATQNAAWQRTAR